MIKKFKKYFTKYKEGDYLLLRDNYFYVNEDEKLKLITPYIVKIFSV